MATGLQPLSGFYHPGAASRKPRSGDREQIQLLFGHASVQTTERYPGTRQNLAEAVNDELRLVEF